MDNDDYEICEALIKNMWEEIDYFKRGDRDSVEFTEYLSQLLIDLEFYMEEAIHNA